MSWYHSSQFATEPLKARELEIKSIENAIASMLDDMDARFEIAALKKIIENLRAIPEDKVAVCSVCHAVYDSRYSYSVCSDSCFRDKFM